MATKKTGEPKKTPQETQQSTIKKLEETIQKLTMDVAEKNDKYLRTLADYQNYQKRMDKELACREETLKKQYLLWLLDFQELLKKAAQDANPKEGLQLLISNLEKFFEKECVTYIDCKGKPFDHSVHHAVSLVETDECNDETILDEVKKGYMLGDKLLRPSQVIVGKKKTITP